MGIAERARVSVGVADDHAHRSPPADYLGLGDSCMCLDKKSLPHSHKWYSPSSFPSYSPTEKLANEGKDYQQ